MDPKKTYGMMLEAFAEGRIYAAKRHAADLVEWIENGGMNPIGGAVSEDTPATDIYRGSIVMLHYLATGVSLS